MKTKSSKEEKFQLIYKLWGYVRGREEGKEEECASSQQCRISREEAGAGGGLDGH